MKIVGSSYKIYVVVVVLIAVLCCTGVTSETTCPYNQVYNKTRSCPPSCGYRQRDNCPTTPGCVCPPHIPYHVGDYCEAQCPVQNLHWEIRDMESYLSWERYGSAIDNAATTTIETCTISSRDGELSCAVRSLKSRTPISTSELKEGYVQYVQDSCKLYHEPVPSDKIQIRLNTIWKSVSGKEVKRSYYFRIGHTEKKRASIKKDTNLTAPVMSVRPPQEPHSVMLNVSPSKKVLCNTNSTKYVFYVSNSSDGSILVTKKHRQKIHKTDLNIDCDHEVDPLIELQPELDNLESGTYYYGCGYYIAHYYDGDETEKSPVGCVRFKTKDNIIIWIGVAAAVLLVAIAVCFLLTTASKAKRLLIKDKKKNEKIFQSMNASNDSEKDTRAEYICIGENEDKLERLERTKSTTSSQFSTDAGYQSDSDHHHQQQKSVKTPDDQQKLLSNDKETPPAEVNEYTEMSDDKKSNEASIQPPSSELPGSSQGGYVRKAVDSGNTFCKSADSDNHAETIQSRSSSDENSQFIPSVTTGYAKKAVDNSYRMKITPQSSVESQNSVQPQSSIIYAKVAPSQSSYQSK